jgi:hypothetical protein
MAAPVELKPFRTCLGRPLKRPKGKVWVQLQYTIIFLEKQ